MDLKINGVFTLFLASFLLGIAGIQAALSEKRTVIKPSSSQSLSSDQINSNSVLIALLDSHYTELAELVEKALLLQTLEDAVGKHNTIFAPRNEALERDLDLDPEFKRFMRATGPLPTASLLPLLLPWLASISSFE